MKIRRHQPKKKELTEAEILEISFLSCLLQAIQNRTEEMQISNTMFAKGVKQKSNILVKEIDRVLDPIYDSLKQSALDNTVDKDKSLQRKSILKRMDLAHDTIMMVDSHLDNAWSQYMETKKS